MGVDRTDYLMWGVDVGYKSFDWDKHEAEVEGRPGVEFNIILDGMSGKYCIAGKIIAVSDAYDGFEMNKISLDALSSEDRVLLAKKISKAFDKSLSADDISLILFSHFS